MPNNSSPREMNPQVSAPSGGTVMRRFIPKAGWILSPPRMTACIYFILLASSQLNGLLYYFFFPRLLISYTNFLFIPGFLSKRYTVVPITIAVVSLPAPILLVVVLMIASYVNSGFSWLVTKNWPTIFFFSPGLTLRVTVARTTKSLRLLFLTLISSKFWWLCWHTLANGIAMVLSRARLR